MNAQERRAFNDKVAEYDWKICKRNLKLKIAQISQRVRLNNGEVLQCKNGYISGKLSPPRDQISNLRRNWYSGHCITLEVTI